MINTNTFIIYQGPSMLDGAPIAVLATGFDTVSTNSKTGGLIQTYIIRSDIAPMNAIWTGQDASICGNCIHRGLYDQELKKWIKPRSCYVKVFQAVTGMYKAFKRGSYSVMPASEISERFSGLKVRFGAYGDPAAIPFEVWAPIQEAANSWTGYTHQWRDCDPRIASICMASADTLQDHIDAKKLGYRTFRTLADSDQQVKGEATCPASKEAGYKLQCSECMACSGGTKRRGSIAIRIHGTASNMKAFNNSIAA